MKSFHLFDPPIQTQAHVALVRGYDISFTPRHRLSFFTWSNDQASSPLWAVWQKEKKKKKKTCFGAPRLYSELWRGFPPSYCSSWICSSKRSICAPLVQLLMAWAIIKMGTVQNRTPVAQDRFCNGCPLLAFVICFSSGVVVVLVVI